jgi:hypothetical protein
VARIDLLQYFEPSVDPHTHTQLASTLAESRMLVSSAKVPSTGKQAQQQMIFTLRLPLTAPKGSAADIVNDTEALIEQVDKDREYIEIQVEPASIEQVEETFWKQLVALVDWDNSGSLDEAVSSSEACVTRAASGTISFLLQIRPLQLFVHRAECPPKPLLFYSFVPLTPKKGMFVCLGSQKPSQLGCGQQGWSVRVQRLNRHSICIV